MVKFLVKGNRKYIALLFFVVLYFAVCQIIINSLSNHTNTLLHLDSHQENQDVPIQLPKIISDSLVGHDVRAIKPRKTPILFIDGFTLNDELDMLELRIEELKHVVDYFVIVEAKFTFQNTPKTLHFQMNKKRFEKYSDQIIHIIVDSGAQKFEYWENEVKFRNAIGRFGIQQVKKILNEKNKKLSDEDLIMISDVDEFPKPQIIEFLKTHQGYPALTKLDLRWSYYSFLWLNKGPWVIKAVVNVGDLGRYTNNTYDTNWVRFNGIEIPEQNTWTIGKRGEWSGWHCSWCVQPESMKVKLESFAHKELNLEHYKSLEELNKRRKNGMWFNGVVEGDRVTPTSHDTIPETVIKNKKFEYMLD
ncbi:beta-mannosyl-glycoprotein 4-beta-N-acetylglucosaminyltransferase [Acrasis kona]|uniref:Beta-mannosyl-glycoprotein 4-beta-N-acetylglucosaminyltransferase n=1 Tax=Acrasis kona TaxID=1008807 RepID=A0AAW2Z3H2_9EUKA